MDPIRLGFIGVGLRGSGRVVRIDRHFQDRARFVALADLDPDSLSGCAAQLESSVPETATVPEQHSVGL